MPWYVAWAPTPSDGRLGDVFIGPNSILSIGEKLFERKIGLHLFLIDFGG
jgi:hypothetical protein